MKTKRFIALFVVLAMVFACALTLVACTEPHKCESKCEICDKCTNNDCKEDVCKDKCPGHDDDGKSFAETLVEGTWVYSYARVDTIVFHEDGKFYLDQFTGGQQVAGYWELVEEKEALTWTEHDMAKVDAGIETFESDTYIILTNFDGSHITNDIGDYKYPLHDGKIRDIHFTGAYFEHDVNGTIQESPITIAEYYVEGFVTYSLSLGHNGQFEDFIDGENFIAGTWTYDATTRVYTLTSTGGTATLTISEDGETALYKAIDGSEKTLINANIALKPVYAFEAYDEENDNVKGRVELYNEESAAALFIGGTKVAEGTWEHNEDTNTFTLVLGETGTFTTTLNSVGIPSFTIEQEGGDNFVFVLLVENQPQVRFTGSFMVNGMFQGNTEVLLYDDGSATFATSVDMSAAGMGVVPINEAGTWSLDPTTYHMTMTIPVEDGDDRVFTAAPVDAQGTYKFTYIFSYGSLQNVEVEMTKVALVEEVTVKKELSTTITIVPGVVENVPFTLTFTSDGKVTLASSMGIEITADWALTVDGVPSITFSNASNGEFGFTLGAEVTFTWVGKVSDQMPGNTTITFTMASSELADFQ